MILPVQVTFRNMSRSDRIEEYVREQTADLDSYYNHIMGCRVVIEIPHRHQVAGDHYSIRIRLTVPGGEVVVNRQPSLHARQQAAKEPRRNRTTDWG